GMKTGFICASGFNIVASANRSGRSLAVVLLGAETAKERAEMAARLLDDGFRRRLRGGGGSLASFRTRGQGPLVNLRQQVCGKETGFICASGFNIVASANRSGRSLAVVLLGAETAKERAEMAARLLDDGFRRRLRGGGGSLASFRTRGQGPLVNLRQQVCGK